MSIDKVLDLHQKQAQKQKIIDDLKQNPYMSLLSFKKWC